MKKTYALDGYNQTITEETIYPIRSCEGGDEKPMVLIVKDEDNWIPVEEGLPKERDSIFARFKGTDRWKSGMWEKISDHVLVTFMLDDGFTAVDLACTHDGKWVFDRYAFVLRPRTVTAWMPLPEPYKGGDSKINGGLDDGYSV